MPTCQKKKYIKSFMLTVLVLLAASSCRKYEDEPSYSLRTRKARVVNKWIVEQVVFEGNDITKDYLNGNDLIFVYKKDKKYVVEWGNYKDHGTWDFDQSQHRILASSYDSPYNSTIWEINKLEHKRMWVTVVTRYGIGPQLRLCPY